MRTPQRHWRDITQSCRITSKVNNRLCAAYLGGISDFYYKLRSRSKERGPDCRKTSIVIQKWGLGRSPKAGRRDASPRIHPRHGCRACMHKGFSRTQSQPSIHSLSRGKGGRGIGIINQKFISKTDFSYNLRPRSKERGLRPSINPRTAKMQINHLTQN